MPVIPPARPVTGRTQILADSTFPAGRSSYSRSNTNSVTRLCRQCRLRLARACQDPDAGQVTAGGYPVRSQLADRWPRSAAARLSVAVRTGKRADPSAGAGPISAV